MKAPSCKGSLTHAKSIFNRKGRKKKKTVSGNNVLGLSSAVALKQDSAHTQLPTDSFPLITYLWHTTKEVLNESGHLPDVHQPPLVTQPTSCLQTLQINSSVGTFQRKDDFGICSTSVLGNGGGRGALTSLLSLDYQLLVRLLEYSSELNFNKTKSINELNTIVRFGKA